MGLDGLDIVYRIERTFGVELSLDDFSGIVRDNDVLVGDLYKLVLKKLGLREVARYDVRLNFAFWQEIQRAIHTATDVPMGEVELKTPLETLFPRQTRRAKWAALCATSPYRIRRLDYSWMVRAVGFSLAATMVVNELLQVWRVPGLNWLWPILGLLGVWIFVETYAKMLRILSPLRNRFPSGITTVKDLCRAVLAINYEEVCRDAAIPLDERCVVVWQQLTDILVGALGVEADQITFHARLVKDLGMQ